MNKRRVFKVVTIVGIPVLALLAAELLLAALDYRTTYEREDPFLGFRSVTSLFEERQAHDSPNGAVYATRESKLAWFNDQHFEVDKPANGYRVFTFGGSTTYGRPYDHTTSFSNWLRILLDAADPSTPHEVVNAGGVSYASYRVVNLMNEMVEYEPDLFIVYTGHNEFLEDRTYSDLLEEPEFVSEVRTRLHRSRTYSLARNVWLDVQGGSTEPTERKFQMDEEVTAILDQSFGLEQYQRDREKEDAIVRHFRYNLERMVEIARDEGVRLIFVVPPSNEKDFSPFKSQVCSSLRGERRGRWLRLYEAGRARLRQAEHGAARDAFQRALELDSCHADLRYRMGETWFALGRPGEAKREFVQSRDLDVAPLRATSRIQETVREVARTRDVPAVDLVAQLERQNRENLGHDILGEEAFLDHAHPRIRVHQELAERLAHLIVERSWTDVERPLAEIETVALYDSLMATLDSSYHATRDLNLAKVLTWLGKTEEAAGFIDRAVEGLPDHPEAHYLQGTLFQHRGRFQQAARAYERAVALDSTFGRAYNALGSVYERTDQLEKAIDNIRQAVRYQPESDHAYFNLGNTLYRAGRQREAIQAYERALSLNPRHSQAWNNLAAVHIGEENYAEATEALEKTLELEPENVRAHQNLGLVHYNRGRLDRAREMFERVLEIRPDDEFALRWLDRLDEESRR